MEADTRSMGQPIAMTAIDADSSADRRRIDGSVAMRAGILQGVAIRRFLRRRNAPSVRSLLVLAIAATGLAACAQRFEPEGLETITQITEVSRSRAMIVPGPGQFGVTGVLERRYANAYTQQVLLQTSARRPGQNNFRVSFMLPGGSGGTGEDDLDVSRLSPETVSRDIRAQFPDIDMAISDYFVQNRFGPFGYATGRSSSGDNCLYAWQLIAPEYPRPLFSAPRGKIDIRLQLCDSTATTASLLDVMYNFTINAYLARWKWQPLGDTPPVDAAIGEPGAELRPLASPAVLQAPFGDVEPVVRARPATRSVRADADDVFAYESAATRRQAPHTIDPGDYPTVPLPP